MAKKIAIVEDDPSITQMYQLKFGAEGYVVFTAKNGVEGLEVIEKHKPDVVLLDLMMPEMTGGEMLAKMRQTDWGKNIKVIILTNVSQDEALPSIHSLNVDGFIVKAHYTPQEVLETVTQVLSNQTASRQ